MAVFKGVDFPRYFVYDDSFKAERFDPSSVELDAELMQSFEKVKAIVNTVLSYSAFSHTHMLDSEFVKLNELFNNRYVLFFGLKNAIPVEFAKFVIRLFEQESASLSLREALLPLIVNLTFDYPGFSKHFGSERNIALLGTFVDDALKAPRRTEKLTKFMRYALKAIYNIAAFDSSLFSLDFLMKYVNWVIRSMKDEVLLKHTTFYMLNFFRFGDVDHDQFVQLMVQLFHMIIRQRPITAPVCLNVCRCMYYWLKRSRGFMDVLVMPLIFSFVMEFMVCDNADICSVCGSIMSYAVISNTFGFPQRLREQTPIQAIVDTIARNDSSVVYLLSFVTNFATLGAEFIDQLLSEPLLDTVNAIFPDANCRVKTCIGQLLIVLVSCGNESQRMFLATQELALIFDHLFVADIPSVTKDVLESIVTLTNRSRDFAFHLDQDTLASLTDNEEYGHLAQTILNEINPS